MSDHLIDVRVLADRVESGMFKALSIKQPWPHRIFHEGKDVENRDWTTRHRGWTIVHAGKKDDEDRALIRSKALPLGGVVGMMRIVDCVESMDSPWFCGRYGFVIDRAFPIPLVACRGALGFFTPDRDVCTAIANHIRAGA